MAYWLDLIGSYIIAGTIILMIGRLNVYILNSSNENLQSNREQLNLSTSADIIDYDFYKIGYRITGDKIVIADSDKIKFYADIDNNGTGDTLYYYAGDLSELSSTKNPNDKLLYRILNNEIALSATAVTDFKLTYFDSLIAQIFYSFLVNICYRLIFLLWTSFQLYQYFRLNCLLLREISLTPHFILIPQVI